MDCKLSGSGDGRAEILVRKKTLGFGQSKTLCRVVWSVGRLHQRLGVRLSSIQLDANVQAAKPATTVFM